MQDVQLSFALEWPWWLVLAVTVLGLLAAAMFYRRAARVVSRRYLVLLLALRAGAILALFLCLFQPVIKYRRGVMKRSTLLVLADRSRSMSVHDFPGQPNRFERVRNVLLDPDGPAAELDKRFDIRWFTFADHASALAERTALNGLTADGEATDFLTSTKDALEGLRPDEVGGIVLLSDGISTTEEKPARVAELGVPFYAVGVGSVLRTQEDFQDIAIDGVEAKREVTVKTATPIHVAVEAFGYPDRVVPVILSENGVEVARERLVLDNARGVQKITLKYAPQNKGDFELTISIPADAAERITENNTLTVPVFVGDPKIRVLYIEGVVRSEYRALRRVLEFDPNVEILFLVQVGPRIFLQQGNIADVKLDGPPKTHDEWKQFKVLLIGSLDSAALSDEQMKQIRRFVKEGGGLMMLGGEFSFGPGGYSGTPVEEALPVICGGRNIGQERDPFPLALTAAGKAHPIFAGLAGFFGETGRAASSTLPKLLGCTRVQQAKPAAEVLAVNPKRRNKAGPLIALAAGRYGAGRSLAATIDSTHLWYMPLRGMGRESPYVRYWGQAVRWLAGSDDSPRAAGPGVTAYTDRHFYDPGSEPRIHAFVTDPEGQATARAVVKAEIIHDGEDSGPTIQLSPVQGTRNEYETQLPPPDPGKYRLVVRARLENQDLGEANLAFFVGEPTREFERLDLDADTLSKIADATGGLYLPLISFDQLPRVLRARSEQEVQHKTIYLWNSPLLFVAFLFLVTSEWVLRKRRLLS